MMRAPHRLLYLCVGIALVATYGWAQPSVSPLGVARLTNDFLSIAVLVTNGSLVNFADARTGQGFCGVGHDLWQISLVGGQGSSGTVQSSQARSFEVDQQAGMMTLTWRDFPSPIPPGLQVRATLRLEPGHGLARWRISVLGLATNRIESVVFPSLHEIPPQSGEKLAVPMWMGQIAANPRGLTTPDNPKRFEWHYPGELSMQCLAFWGDKAGLYVACDDTRSYLKSLIFRGDSKGAVGVQVLHRPEADGPQGEWSLPYDVVTGVFHGDWFTAAEQYRSWATNQPWAVESRLSANSMPSWVTNTALWVWNRGRSSGVLQPAVELRKRLGLPVSVFWHWWHGCSYDAGFPEYLPPREGEGSFRQALHEAQAEGVSALVYMNQRLWGMTTASWTNESAARWAVKRANGEIQPEVYNTFTKQPCASMCLGTPFWRAKYAGLAEEAICDLGVNGIYMDQACLSMACYDRDHGHPAGGGTYWVGGFTKLAEDIRSRSRVGGSPMPALAGEGCGESWLPHLDIMLSLQVSRERYAAPDGWETIPFFHAVYHPYAVFFGNYSSLTMPPYDDLWPAEFAPKEPLALLDRKFSTQFYLEQARSFVWGQQPTIANFLPEHLQSRDRELDFLIRLSKVRANAAQYLLRGTMLRAPSITADSATIDMSRLSIYAGQQGSLRAFTKTVPLALVSAWRSPMGKVAFVVASIAGHEQRTRISIVPNDYGFKGAQQVYEITDLGRRQLPLRILGDHDDDTIELNLSPFQLSVFEFEAIGP